MSPVSLQGHTSPAVLHLKFKTCSNKNHGGEAACLTSKPTWRPWTGHHRTARPHSSCSPGVPAWWRGPQQAWLRRPPSRQQLHLSAQRLNTQTEEEERVVMGLFLHQIINLSSALQDYWCYVSLTSRGRCFLLLWLLSHTAAQTPGSNTNIIYCLQPWAGSK